MSFFEEVKQDWYDMLAPLEQTHSETEGTVAEMISLFADKKGHEKAIFERATKNITAGLEACGEMLKAYRTKIDNFKEEDIVSEDLDYMVSEFKRLQELVDKNYEYFKSREEDFS